MSLISGLSYVLNKARLFDTEPNIEMTFLFVFKLDVFLQTCVVCNKGSESSS